MIQAGQGVNIGHEASSPYCRERRLRPIRKGPAPVPTAGSRRSGGVAPPWRAAALDTVFQQIRDTGSSLGSSAPVYPFAEMNRLMGFEEVWRFDREHAEI